MVYPVQICTSRQVAPLAPVFSAQGWAQVSKAEGCAARAASHLLCLSAALISLNDYFEVSVN